MRMAAERAATRTGSAMTDAAMPVIQRVTVQPLTARTVTTLVAWRPAPMPPTLKHGVRPERNAPFWCRPSGR